MKPETVEELILAWRSDMANFDTENPSNTASILLNRLSDNEYAQGWCTNYPRLQKISDILVDIEGVPGNHDELDNKAAEHHQLFDEVENLIGELEEEIVY